MVKFDRLIKPGQKGRITLSLRLSSRSGPFIKQAVVRTNDPRRPKITLRLKGIIVTVPKEVQGERPRSGPSK